MDVLWDLGISILATACVLAASFSPYAPTDGSVEGEGRVDVVVPCRQPPPHVAHVGEAVLEQQLGRGGRQDASPAHDVDWRGREAMSQRSPVAPDGPVSATEHTAAYDGLGEVESAVSTTAAKAVVTHLACPTAPSRGSWPAA